MTETESTNNRAVEQNNPVDASVETADGEAARAETVGFDGMVTDVTVIADVADAKKGTKVRPQYYLLATVGGTELSIIRDDGQPFDSIAEADEFLAGLTDENHYPSYRYPSYRKVLVVDDSVSGCRLGERPTLAVIKKVYYGNYGSAYFFSPIDRFHANPESEELLEWVKN